MKGFSSLKSLASAAWLLIGASTVQLAPAGAQQWTPGAVRRAPFTATLSNNTPLVFGMDVSDASRALGEPLSHVNGRPGDEIYLAIRNLGGSGLLNHHDRLFLQFRKGRLTGWKGDWGHNWMWQ
jgi:hypothetical protein